jgi:hypothetical protein
MLWQSQVLLVGTDIDDKNGGYRTGCRLREKNVKESAAYSLYVRSKNVWLSLEQQQGYKLLDTEPQDGKMAR